MKDKKLKKRYWIRASVYFVILIAFFAVLWYITPANYGWIKY